MIIGIDLGTTNSLAAYYTENGPVIIPNRLGENLTPSVVSIDEEGTVFIGATAKERMALYPESCASVFKRDMGSDKKYMLSGKPYTAVELSSLVLRSLKEDAEVYLGEEVTEAVISVPAYFNDVRRKATKRAGEMAGLKVERIISEPTAAAIAYGLLQDEKPSKNLVFDLGGGTFDVSILDYFHPILEVRAVAGDNYLGGEDFTNVIEKIFFERNSGLEKESLSSKEREYIHREAEKAKITLSSESEASMHCHFGEKSYEAVITISQYERACEDLFERIRIPVKRALSDAMLKISDINKIVLVGGATKQTSIRSFVSKIFRTFPDTSINPDEAVALGAAIQGAIKERNESIKEIIMTDVCSFTLGTSVTVDLGDHHLEGGHYCPILERNTVIPASRTERLYTVNDNQEHIKIDILQGESRIAKNNLLLGVLEIDVPKAKAGEEAVDVTYTYDINSILEVEVKSVSTGKKERCIIKGQYTEMTDEEIEARLKELSYLKIHPRDQEENKLVLLRMERLYEESLGQDRNVLEAAVNKFELALNSQDKRLIEQERKKLIEFMDEWEGL
ncbi:MAG: molecular chaperone HscC [Eubacterium sp.]|nr:molecular chaperone HscC [Eubacterium sp.]SEF54498.1 molecular chaperone HscC [Eubacterium ruminantium]